MDESGRLKLVVDVALFRANRVLLVRYRDAKKYDGQRGWFLPDDYMRRLEHPEKAARRILVDQLGMEVRELRLGFIESFEGNGAWHLIFHYVGHVRGATRMVPGANTAAAEWFDLDRLPDRADVAHDGWAVNVIEALRKAP